MDANLLIKEEKRGGHTLKVYYDTCPESPREEYDNFGIIYTARNDYNPDNNTIYDLMNDVGAENMEDLRKALEKDYYFLPIDYYEHGGITIYKATGNVRDKWDCGFFGIIAVHKTDPEIATMDEKQVLDILESEIKTYDQYLTGEVYCYVLYDENDNEVDSMSGFYSIEGIDDYVQPYLETA